MSELMKIAKDLEARIYTSSQKEMNTPEFEYKVFRRQVLRACEAFVIKDLPTIANISADMARGLLLNRIRTNLCNLQVSYSFKKNFVRNVFLQFNRDKTDVISIHMYTRFHSNDEITGNPAKTDYTTSCEVKFLARVFDEINAARSIKAFVNLTASNNFSEKSTSLFNSPFSQALSDFSKINFHND